MIRSRKYPLISHMSLFLHQLAIFPSANVASLRRTPSPPQRFPHGFVRNSSKRSSGGNSDWRAGMFLLFLVLFSFLILIFLPFSSPRFLSFCFGIRCRTNLLCCSILHPHLCFSDKMTVQ